MENGHLLQQLEEVDRQIAELMAIRERLLEQLNQVDVDVDPHHHHQLPPSSSARDQILVNLDEFSGDQFEWSAKLSDLLRQRFQITSFRPLQQDIMNASMSGYDVVGILSTGTGKSLCYQLPSLLANGLTVVISPLISLIEDQVMELQQRNIPAAMLTSFTPKTEIKAIFDSLTRLSTLRGSISSNNEWTRLLFITPERVAKSNRVLSALEKLYKNGRLFRIVIDEAHCCSQYGHDFRPDYKKLGVLKRSFPSTPLLALTATCPDFVLSSMMSILSLNKKSTVVYAGNLNRPNLNYSVVTKPSSFKDGVQFIVDWIQQKHPGQKGIIYCLSQKDSETVATAIDESTSGQIRCAVYHAGLTDQYKSSVHEKWRTGSIQVVVATIAFGLGINNPEVRFVIHHSMSKSMEGYYQESGRAGRDGKPADCLLLFRGQDASRLTSLVQSESEGLRNVYGMLRYCNSFNQCRRVLMKEYFGSETGSQAGEYSTALAAANQWQPVGGDDQDLCRGQCDACQQKHEITKIDMTLDAWTCCKIIEVLRDQFDERLTLVKLIDVWCGRLGSIKNKAAIDVLKSTKYDLFAYPAPKTIDAANRERMVLQLLLDGYLKEDFHYTAYSCISYITIGRKGRTLLNYTTLASLPAKVKPLDFELLKEETHDPPQSSTKKASKKPSSASSSSRTQKRPKKEENMIDLTGDNDDSDFELVPQSTAQPTFNQDDFVPTENDDDDGWEFDI